jgi:hypothetical protein
MAKTPEIIAADRDQAASGRLRRWLMPSLFDLIVVSLPFWYFTLDDGGLLGLLVDGDTGWHTRTGDWIRQNGMIVRHDIFSFTKSGAPWFAWEWLCDVLFSFLSQAAGWKGLAFYGVVLGTLFFGLTFRHLVWRGANLFIALGVSLIVFGCSTVHLLSRPHLWTMAFTAGAVFLIQSDLRNPTRWIWALVPLTILWANLHGGWLALVALLGMAAVGVSLEAAVRGGSWMAGHRYGIVAALCMAASLVNPYGWQLHVHTFAYLRADWIKEVVSEFRSPTFRSENMMQYELLLLAGAAAAGLMLRRREFVGPLWIAFWAHQSLVSTRHVTLFAAVAAPFIADELQRGWSVLARRAPRKSTARILDSMAVEAAPAISRMTPWGVVVLLLAAMPGSPVDWPKDVADIKFPSKMIAAHQEFLKGRRLFTEDRWAGYLIYRSYPAQKVFFDGRSDFYGESLTNEYLAALMGKYNWREVLDKYRIDAVMVQPRWGLATLLKNEPGWRVVDDDKQSVLLERVAQAPTFQALAGQKGLRNSNETPMDRRR